MTPVIAPEIQLQLEALGVTLDAPALALRDRCGRARPQLQDRVVARAQALTFSNDFDYDRGISSLDSGRYDRAVEAFDKVIATGGKKVEGAMYWKAYALGRLGKRDEAIRTLEDLQKKFPSSRWTGDAKALLVDVRQASGQPVSADVAGDEELKLIALNGLMMRDPDSAIPLVEKLLAGSASPKLKERGLFVLAQSASPRAKTLLAEIAKGKGNPDLQLKALDYLGAFGSGPDVPLLVDVYKSTGDVDVKKRVIRSLGMTRTPRLWSSGATTSSTTRWPATWRSARPAASLNGRGPTWSGHASRRRPNGFARRPRRHEIAPWSPAAPPSRGASRRRRSDPPPAPNARRCARPRPRNRPTRSGSSTRRSPSVELKREILANMRFTTQRDRLLQIARTDGNSELRRAAVQGLVLDRTPEATDLLLGLYRNEKDAAVKRQILDHLIGTSSAATLVQIARQETDPAVRKRLVERLSMMKDKEAVDYMMEILKK